MYIKYRSVWTDSYAYSNDQIAMAASSPFVCVLYNHLFRDVTMFEMD